LNVGAYPCGRLNVGAKNFSPLQELGKLGKEDRKFAGINIYPYLCNVKNNNYANIIKHLRLYTEIKNEENRKCLVLRG
jgi:hypothetical protein